ncbi:hypothetical protein AURDEDRAFT_166622 [Auricularia subglabra TFB-10046 SS5]|nr:hypothetical protein AURDEDRAFT_166622 [Auricularia subglabra TFB-10046 SS5]
MSVARWPPVILFLVYDYCDFADLLPCTHVSRHWRAYGRAHSTYWKKLVITGYFLTPGAVSLFLERLNQRHDDQATIEFTLSCASVKGNSVAPLVQGLQEHARRVEVVLLSITAEAASRLRALFALSLPQLRDLCVFFRSFDKRFTPLSSMFDSHKFNTLQNVVLIDVPLSATLASASHVIKSLTIVYFDCPPLVAHALAWNYRADCMLSLASSRRPLDLTPASRGSISLPQHVSLRCENWLPALRSLFGDSVPHSLLVGTASPTLEDALQVLPPGPELCICIKTQMDISWMHGGLEWGVVAITTPDRQIIRLFDRIDLGHMVSQAFLQGIVQADKIVTLVLSLAYAFMAVCHDPYCFPRLETLCLGIGMLPADPWTWGTVECPRLRTLALQSEWEGYTPFITMEALRSFIDHAFVLGNAPALQVVLRDVGLAGTPIALLGVPDSEAFGRNNPGFVTVADDAGGRPLQAKTGGQPCRASTAERFTGAVNAASESVDKADVNKDGWLTTFKFVHAFGLVRARVPTFNQDTALQLASALSKPSIAFDSKVLTVPTGGGMAPGPSLLLDGLNKELSHRNTQHYMGVFRKLRAKDKMTALVWPARPYYVMQVKSRKTMDAQPKGRFGPEDTPQLLVFGHGAVDNPDAS